MLIRIFLFALIQVAVSHSWVERLFRIAPNGTMVNPPGFMRAYTPRTAGFDEEADLNLIPPNGRSDGKIIHSNNPICKSIQTISNYSSDYPMLNAAPGDIVALQYQENGHTADGQGGDQRGRLLAEMNFDDGQCYQINGGNISVDRQGRFPKAAEDPQGSDLWCQADVRLPCDLPGGTMYTLVLIPEIYTSCMDINMTSASLWNEQIFSFITGQDLNCTGIYKQLEHIVKGSCD
ncbi:hypothetical protein M406DRAFT_343683 [Cryphonectria parasitica EP155]|uniref:DUF7492 domain-containing protein n=1 Tax=Cryphonectria parasitica (strain ATCC 38755 / EP155) TaxID=660469 RepID=A0A9P5CHE0_CRYP1|nr:uncharacterized protein M406DRAFT_343683 [Cryphonectria parasitica EP155]KAF3760099.1 hypothetical protein M406DRAFT_343683 [Cryphonectria parasitica EP155]